jgi:ElaB/YqjD/DUF883 family membrane-anchored ribosome-binding protein
MTIQEANEKLSADLQAVMRDAEALMNATDGVPGTHTSEIRNRLASALENAKGTYHRWQDKVVDKAKDAAKATDNTVREHPYESMGVALGVGILLGVLVGRRL